MMTAFDFYEIISSVVPLYISMFIGYSSVKWWKLLNEEQCLGISRFCSLIAVPVLSFVYILKTDLHEMNFKILGADVLQKVIVMVVLACWYKLGPKGSIERIIAIFSICTLPNALILGVPIIRSMYHATPLVVEIFVIQSVIWHTLLLIMYEYRAARIVISQQFGDNQGVAGGISSTDTRVDEVEATHVDDDGGGEREDLEIPVRPKGQEPGRNQPPARNDQGNVEEVSYTSKAEVISEIDCQHVSNRLPSMPSSSAMIKQIVIMVWKKLKSNPNAYATLLGLIWAFVTAKFNIARPLIVIRLVTFLSNASLGMGMFNMGLSMGLQPTLIPCGKVVAALALVLRFVIGPIVMAFASLVVGLRGTLFLVAVVQAAASQGIAPSVFAVEYNVYPKIVSFGSIFGMVVALPVTLLYYGLFEILR